MKRFCQRYEIATAPFAVFEDPDAAERHVRAAGRPLVVKADGLAAGKGVVVAESVDEACAAIDRIVRKRELGDAGATVVLEERLAGEEASFHVVCDGTRAVPLAAAQDHKRVADGDRGPNTGGMGAYAPAPVVTPEVHERVMREIVGPTLRGMAADGTPFRGVLFVGLMIDAGTPRVLEYNARFGDPEATVLVPTYDGDWFELLEAAARGDLSAIRPRPARGAALSVVMAAAGYPGKPRTGDRITGLETPIPEGAFVLHAGTAKAADGSIVTNGGRVLTVGARASTLEDAARIAYDLVGRIHWEGEHHRRDIGGRALRPEKEGP
jgi:phosphoribosylamine--glycine ligase